MKRKILSLVGVLALVASLVTPMAVFAAGTGESEGDVEAGNSAPTFSLQTLKYQDGTALTSSTLDPYDRSQGNGYKLAFTVTDANSLDDIDTITVYIHYDSDSDNATADASGGSDDVNTQFKMIWTASTGNFTVGSVGSTTFTDATDWALDAVNSDEPNDLTVDSGEWIYYFQIGKVATEDATGKWDVYIAVVDNGGGTTTWDATLLDHKMSTYDEILVSPATISFGTVTMGTTGNAATGTPYPLEATTIDNGAHKVQIYADGTWTADTESFELSLETATTSAGDREIVLWADGNETSESVKSYAECTSASQQVKASGSELDIATGLTIRESVSGTKVYSKVYLDLGTKIPVKTYFGTATYKVVSE